MGKVIINFRKIIWNGLFLSLIILVFITSCSGNFLPIATSTLQPTIRTQVPTPTEEKIIYNPPINGKIVSNSELDFVDAADTITNLRFMISYSWRDSYDTRIKFNQLHENGNIFYLYEDTSVLLLEIQGEKARIKFIEPYFNKNPGDLAWILKQNIKY
jgi:hypothetical protein